MLLVLLTMDESMRKTTISDFLSPRWPGTGGSFKRSSACGGRVVGQIAIGTLPNYLFRWSTRVGHRSNAAYFCLDAEVCLTEADSE